MSSAGTRERVLPLYIVRPGERRISPPVSQAPSTRVTVATGSQRTESVSHPRNRATGHYDGGGPFYTSRIAYDISPGYVTNGWVSTLGVRYTYTGPYWADLSLTSTEKEKLSLPPKLEFGDRKETQMKADGTTAISLCNPVNPASNLGTSLAELHREGLPSLPGIKLWKDRTAAARAAGSEYLNYEFGWAPMIGEVTNVRDAARHSRDIMNQYHRDEGRNTHRRFDFSPDHNVTSYTTTGYPVNTGNWRSSQPGNSPKRVITKTTVTKRWFEGCFTYGLPSSTDSWGRLVGIGSQADQLFGLALTPDVLWELTPWSWAVDWFSNAGDVINNVTNFGLAGLVMRYGYMMTEDVTKIQIEHGSFKYNRWLGGSTSNIDENAVADPCSGSIIITTKRRVPASPFGFSVGWEGLSPTQLAITAALGISRFL